MDHAIDKLEVMGEHLPYPHQSAVRESNGIRELRPRSGRSPWRGFYKRVGEVLVFLAVGPEAQVDERGFRRAVRNAEGRLEQLTKEEDKQ